MSDQIRIPCVIMRAGTSKGIFLKENDLPADQALRDKIILRIFGSPDVRQIDGLGALSVYPNPGEHQVQLNIPHGVTLQQAEVFNAIGQRIFTTQSTVLNVSGLAQGVHLIRVTTDAGVKTLRFIRQ